MSRPSLMTGQTLGGRYRIDELLGQGGMSSVYKAYDPNLKRVVAVKMIHSHLASDPKFVSRFEEEAAAVAQLRHPHIVQVFDFNHDEDLYYMVQEFVPGETLQERLRRLHRTGRELPLEQAVAYTRHIAQAAGYAHRRGLIHRDIKPANIMIDVHDQAILMDFGIVKIVGARLPHRHRRRGGHGALPAPRADPRRDARRPLRRVLAGRDALRDGQRQAALRSRVGDDADDDAPQRPCARLILPAPGDARGAGRRLCARRWRRTRSSRFASMDELDAALASLPYR